MRLDARGACLTALLCASWTPTAASAQSWDYRLRTVPEAIYFTDSNPKERLQGSIFFLILEQAALADPKPQSLELIFRDKDKIVRSDRLLAPMLESIDTKGIPPTRVYSEAEAKGIGWPHAYRLFVSLPAASSASTVEARLTFDIDGKSTTKAMMIPIHAYQQKTSLTFPFRGNGIISQAGALSAGHRNRSGLYAVDALGLGPNYGPMLKPGGDENPRDYAGWGREIIAPAAGTVVVARNDHVDQPVAGRSDPTYFLPQYANGGDPGNLVVIDHGNGEFSMIAHMQKGSVRVKVGDRVTQGQRLGLLGNSGDTSGPHVHFQLQNGPDWERSDALPATFANVSSLARGDYFSAK